MRTTTTQAVRPLSALDVIYGRRSVRSYGAQPLEASTVRGLLDAAVQAPTAMLEQPWLFVVVQDRWLLKHISDCAKQLLTRDATTGRARRGDDDANRDGDFAARLADPAFNIFYDAPALVVICAKHMGEFALADCWLAAENLMLAAAALGLGTCCVGAAVPALNTAEVKAVLRIPADVHAVAPIIVGVPAGTVAPAARREPQVISWR
jgi:nitroreductase